MSARSYLLVLVAVSAICIATARKEGPGSEEVIGRSLKQYGGYLSPYRQVQLPQTTQTTQTTTPDGTATPQTITPTIYGRNANYGYPSYQYPNFGYPYHDVRYRNPYNSYCAKGEVPATDDIYKRKACIPEWYFTGAPEPAPAD